MRRLAAALAATTLVVAAGYIVAQWRDGAPVATAATASAEPDAAELDRLIGFFSQRVEETTDAPNRARLARYHLDRAGLTGDLDDYRRANALLDEALAVAPRYRDAKRLLTTARLAVHQFDDALALTRDLLSVDPSDAAALLDATDANIELGRLEVAAGALEDLAALVPSDPAVLVRRAELAHLSGNQLAAVDYAEAARELATVSGLGGRQLAFYSLFEADLVSDLGDYSRAGELAVQALEIAPDWAQGHASLGGALASQGRHAEAIDALTTALNLQPDDPGWLAERADLYTVLGRPEAAASDTSRAVAILSNEDPVIFGRALSRLYADRNIEPAEALRLATFDLEQRRDILGYDTFAWALYRNGRFDEAALAIQPVIDAGLQDAEARFHAGLIMAAVGRSELAVTHLEWVLDTNPGFHPILAAEAEAALATLIR